MIPTAPMLMTVPGDDLVHLVADAQPGEQEAEQARRRASPTAMPTSDARAARCPVMQQADARGDRRDARADQHLALEGDVEHAAALGQDAGQRAQGDRRGELEAAADHARQVRGLAVEERGEDGGDPRRRRAAAATAASGRPRRAASCRTPTNDGRDAGDDPQHADRRLDGDARRRPARRSRTRTSAGVSKLLAREVERERRRATRTRRRGCARRAARAGRRGPRPWPAWTAAVAAVISAPPGRWRDRRDLRRRLRRP